MQKTILITGATDGIGLVTAKTLAKQGHNLLLHGRNPAKLAEAEKAVAVVANGAQIEGYIADMSRLDEVETLANAVKEKHDRIDVLINNAGIFKVADPVTADGQDVRFVVNTLAPYLLTRRLLPMLGATGRVVNLSSATQAPLNTDALAGKVRLSDDMAAYAQSKLAITIWSRVMGLEHKESGPLIVAVNPGSLLASKMVKEGFGVAGNDLSIGADILCRAALADEFADAGGQYFDNDARQFSSPHRDALDEEKCAKVMRVIEAVLAEKQ